MNDGPVFSGHVLEAMARNPDHVWIEPDSAILGWGSVARLDVGSGPGRYSRAQEMLAGLAHGPAFASFTFEVEQPGSVIIVPETVVRVDESGLKILTGDLPDLPARTMPMPVFLGAQANRARWDIAFGRVMDAIAAGEVDKVVLTRRVRARFDDVIPTTSLARGLFETQPDSFVFSISGLVGSSPELLVGLNSRTLRSNPLAGTADRGTKSPDGPAKEKLVREHLLAAESVASILKAHCVSLTRGEMRMAHFADMAHLSTPFQGVVKAGTSVLDVVADLHPTAAVAGTPRANALNLIREIEGHDRGRYTGPIGWFDASGDGTFAIALRCGLISGSRADLYAGAGLVEGSDNDEEYLETEIKLVPMKRALGITPRSQLRS